MVEDPLYENEELVALGLEPWDGEDVDAVIVQADHSEYAKLTPSDLPGAKVIFDGRNILDGSRWAQSEVILNVIGQGDTAS